MAIDRAAALNDFESVAREYSTATVLMHAAIADRLGLGATDVKALDFVKRMGAMTAGELGQLTGLSSASVTALIDRLEKKGFLTRSRDDVDRRKVIIKPTSRANYEIDPAFDSARTMLHDLLAPYSVAEIQLIEGFLRRSTEAVHTSLLREIQRR